jgi:palmitoyltransferase
MSVTSTAVFTLFTSLLLGTHTYLFVLNMTTLEQLSYDRMKTREDILLDRYLDARQDSGEKSMSFAEKLKEKKRMKRKWADQWGNLKTELNIWWLDDQDAAQSSNERRRKKKKKKKTWYHSIGPNWRQAMGDSWYQWVLPFGRAKSDGMHYDTNWRFGEDGLWRMRKDWPKRGEEK